MELNRQQKINFVDILWDYYAHNGRSGLPWRAAEADGSFDPYKIMVSELMLQQTQVGRVASKYQMFIEHFPNIRSLSKAELGAVLRVWQGLGYNRRAKFLWQAAQIVDSVNYFPQTLPELVKLPGVGINTAGAILAYAYNFPAVFVETNVRTVYIHNFFQDRTDVHDKEITALLEQTLDRENPREFYWALMDYGSHLKVSVGNANKASKHYTKQSKFQGSRRQVRGQIIRLLGRGGMPLSRLRAEIVDERLSGVLADLVQEGLVRIADSMYRL